MLLAAFVVGLTISAPVYANEFVVDDGSFKVGSVRMGYHAEYGHCIDNVNYKEIEIDFVTSASNFVKIYSIKKTKNNEIKSYSLTRDKNGKESYSHIRTYKTTQSVKNFYTSTFKETIISIVKNEFTKKSPSNTGTKVQSGGSISSSGSSSNTVFIATNSGKKYHFNSNCRGLSNSRSTTKITLSEAKSRGYTLCGWEK